MLAIASMTGLPLPCSPPECMLPGCQLRFLLLVHRLGTGVYVADGGNNDQIALVNRHGPVRNGFLKQHMERLYERAVLVGYGGASVSHLPLHLAATVFCFYYLKERFSRVALSTE